MQQSIDCRKLSKRSPSLLIKTWQRAGCFDLSLLRYNNSYFSVTDSQKTVQHDFRSSGGAPKILLNAVKFSPIDMKGSKKRGAHERALPKRRNLDEVDFPPQFRRSTNKITMQFFEQWARIDAWISVRVPFMLFAVISSRNIAIRMKGVFLNCLTNWIHLKNIQKFWYITQEQLTVQFLHTWNLAGWHFVDP